MSEARASTARGPARAAPSASLARDAEIVAALERGQTRRALGLCVEGHAARVGRLCMALLGDQVQADQLLERSLLAAPACFAERQPQSSLRAWLLGVARAECAEQAKQTRRRSSLPARAGDAGHPEGREEPPVARRAQRGRSLLARVRANDRDAILLRFVADLSLPEVALACGLDEAATRRRLSRTLLRLRSTTQQEEARSEPPGMCREVHENMADIIDGVAENAWFDHMASCERCRDARYQTEQLVLRLSDAGADYQLPADLEERVLRRSDAAPPVKAGARVSQSPAPHPVQRAQALLRQRLNESGLLRLGERATEAVRSVLEAFSHRASQVPQGPSDSAVSATGAAPRATPAAAPPSAPSAPTSQVQRSRAADAPPPSARWAWLSLLGAVGLGLLWFGSRRPEEKPRSAPPVAQRPPAPAATPGLAWEGRVLHLERAFGSASGLRECARGTQACQVLAPGDVAHPGLRLETDALTRALIRFADGSTLALDRQSQLELDPAQPRRARLLEGNLIAEIEPATGAPRDPAASHAVIDVPVGRVEVLGTKFSLRAGDDGTRVEVSRGSVLLFDTQGKEAATLLAGEAALLAPGSAARVENVLDLGQALAWSRTAFEQQTAAQGALGELLAPGPDMSREPVDALRLVEHGVQVQIVDNVARTQIEEVFENASDAEQAAVFRFPLPPGAQLERLALEVDGKKLEGTFVERERASQRREALELGGEKPGADAPWPPGPWRDPALLAWQRGNRFELGLAPIAARARRRVLLAYSQVLAASEGQRTYSYPLPSAPRGEARIGRFSVEVLLRGHDPAQPVRARGYALAPLDAAPELTRLGFEQNDFAPHGDLSVSFGLADAELRSWAYQPARAEPEAARAAGDAEPVPAPDDHDGSVPADAAYVLIKLRPNLPRRAQHEPRDYVLVVDTSRSMVGERYLRAIEVVTRIIEELDRGDRVTLIACDSSCQAQPEGFSAPGAEAAAAAARFLTGIEPEGASDLAFGIQWAAALRERDAAQHGAGGEPSTAAGASRALRIVYVGDGSPTVGPIHPVLLERAVTEALPLGASVSAVAIGPDSGSGPLRVATRAGGGVSVAFTPGRSAQAVALELLGATYGHTLTNARLELPEGLTRVLPKTLGGLPAGAEALVVARATRPRIAGNAVLRGEVAGEEFEERYPLEVTALPGKANAFVPRLYGAVAIAELESSLDDGARRRSLDLSARFNVPSRQSALLLGDVPVLYAGVGLEDARRALPPIEPENPRRPGLPEDPGETRYRSTTRAPSVDPGGTLKRVWDRIGQLEVPPEPFLLATPERRAELDQRAREHAESRSALQGSLLAALLADDLDAVAQRSQSWSERDPLDPEGLLARADLAAQRGERELAVRILGSAVDAHPSDYKAQWRLARLWRWAGNAERGCRHSLGVAQLSLRDPKLVAEAVGCAREAGQNRGADQLLLLLDQGVRREVEKRVPERRSSDSLAGDFRIDASWDGGEDDLDIVLLDPDGYRVSWMGAPTRAVISASDVLGKQHEAIALRGAPPGKYAIELVRAARSGAVRGTLRVQVGNVDRNLPFVLEGTLLRVATATLRNEPRFVPVNEAYE